MDTKMEINQLLNGTLPTLDDYAEFSGVCERLPKESLWKMITEFPDMHPFLREVATNNLRQKIHEANMARFSQNTLDKFAQKFNRD